MTLLAEYALTPDVFDAACYSGEEACAFHLNALKEVLLVEGLVRDLRNGEWAGLFRNEGREWHRRGKELVKKLSSQGRLLRYTGQRDLGPSTDTEWCAEALATHAIHPMSGGIVVTSPVKTHFPTEVIVAAVGDLPTAPWWARRSSSVRLHRRTTEYLDQLEPLLRSSRSLMFIDPHIDPSRRGYQEFVRLLVPVAARAPQPLIEIHRVCYDGSGASRSMLTQGDIESKFRGQFEADLRGTGVHVEVFVWDDFHDRYFLSNVLGISVPNGFDTTAAPDALTTWTRLGRDDRDDVQREFDPASGRHALRMRFTLP